MKPMNRAFQEFARGAIRPSTGSALGALAIFTLLLGLCMTFITPRRVAAAAGYLSTGEKDEYPFLTADAIRVALSRPDHPSVTILGDSSLREAISDPADLARQISERVGRRVDVHLFTAGGLSLYEQVALTDYLRDHVRGVILLEVAPYNFSYSLDYIESWAISRLGFQSQALRDELRRVGQRPSPRFGNYFLDNLHFFVARCDQVTSFGKAPVQAMQHLFRGGKSWSDAQWDQNHYRVFGWTRGYPPSKQANLAICQRMIQHLQERGDLSVGLLESVHHPRMADHAQPHDRQVLREFRADIAKFALAQGVPLLDMAPAAHLSPDDFLDYTHIGTADARQRYTTALADAAARMLHPPPN